MKYILKQSHILSILAALGILVAVNMLSNMLLSSARFDLTESKLYTLSEGTLKTLNQLQEPIRIKLYYSSEQANGFPVIQGYATRVKGLLKQYSDIAGSNIIVEYIDPKPFSQEEDLAVLEGIQGVPVDQIGNKLYFGISASNSVDDQAVLAFFDPGRQDFLEFDVTTVIDKLSNPNKPVVGIISTLPIKGSFSMPMMATGPWVVYEQLKELYDVKYLEPTVEVLPEGIDVLMLVHPHGLPERLMYHIDQFILKGGKAIIYLDAYADFGQGDVKQSDLAKLLDAYGVKMNADMIVGDESYATRAEMPDENARLASYSNPTWMSMKEKAFNKREVLTAQTNVMRMITPGHVTLPEDSSMEMIPLISTNQGSTVTMKASDAANITNPIFLNEHLEKSDKGLVLAARFSGKVKSAFSEYESEGHVDESAEPVNLIVVADTDMLRDSFWVQKQPFQGQNILFPTADNGAFALNAVDFLSGSGALIGLRSRGTSERRFEVVDALRNEAELKFQEREEKLKTRLIEIENQMNELQQRGGQGSVAFSIEQQKQVDRFREEMLQTRKELRGVQRALKEDIDSLGVSMMWLNIALMPLLVILLSFWLPRAFGMKRG